MTYASSFCQNLISVSHYSPNKYALNIIDLILLYAYIEVKVEVICRELMRTLQDQKDLQMQTLLKVCDEHVSKKGS